MTDHTATEAALDSQGPAGSSPDLPISASAGPTIEWSRPAAIEQAKGVLMVVYGLTADAAFDLLRRHSQTHNVKIRDIASELLMTLSRFEVDSSCRQRFDRRFGHLVRDLKRPLAAEKCEAAEQPLGEPPWARTTVQVLG